MRLRTLLALVLPHLAQSVFLSDFPPRIAGLPSGACSTIYSTPIPVCTANDFSTRNACSVACINALQALVGPIRDACADLGLSVETILVAFLAGGGPESMCGNYDEVIQGEAPSSSSVASATSSATTTEAVTSSATVPVVVVPLTTSSTSTSVSSSVLSTTTNSASASQSTVLTTTTSAPISSSAIAYDTSSTPSQSGTSSSSSAQSTPNGGNGHSGGGSPFDAQGNAGSKLGGSSTVAVLAMLLVVAGLR